MDDIPLVHVGYDDPGALYQLYPPMGLPNPVPVRGAGNTARTALGGMDHKNRIFKGYQRRKAVNLLALKPLAKGPIGVLKTAFPVLPGDSQAGTAQIIKCLGAGLPNT
jgi:hypothetical protein